MAETAVRDRPNAEVRSSSGVGAIPGKYLSITSFRRDGTGVATPVWFVQTGGRLLVETDAGSHKVKRIRRDPRVMIAPCSATGRTRGRPVIARVEILPGSDTHRVRRLLARKYRMDLILIRPIRALQAALHRDRPARPVVLSIRPT